MSIASPVRHSVEATAQPFLHRRQSWRKLVAVVQPVRRYVLRWPGSEGWLLFPDNKGSYQGWFDWLPASLRIGPWHWSSFVFLAVFYLGLCVLQPPLIFPVSTVPAFSPWWYADACAALYSVFVMAVSWSHYGGPWPYLMSYTGWSWCLQTGRAGCTAAGAVLGPSTVVRQPVSIQG